MLNVTLDSLGLETVRGDESFVSRVQDMPVFRFNKNGKVRRCNRTV